MDTKITLIKNYRNKETLRQLTLQEVYDLLCADDYHELVSEFHTIFPLTAPVGNDPDGTIPGLDSSLATLPRICFALEQKHQNGQRFTLSYTGLVLLEANNLPDYDEADAVRKGAAEMPQTLLAFVGADGLSVKIVCRGELYPADRRQDAGGQPQSTDALPQTDDDIALFHENLYERARLIYNGQLGVTVEKLQPTTRRICYLSYDPRAVYNPMAQPIYARPEKPTAQLLRQPSTAEPTEGEYGIKRYENIHVIFEFNLTKAYEETDHISDKEERCHALLTRLAEHCLRTGIPMSIAQRLAGMRAVFWDQQELILLTFQNVYHDAHLTRYLELKGMKRMATIPTETMLTMKINIFLNANYELRKNVMRGVAEYRPRTGIGFAYQDLTEEARNSITMRALEMGIRCWDKDIRRYVNSNDIEHYDPLNDYLEHLPRWDGNDRVMPLARRVPTEYEEWPTLFHIWLRSMVAMWLGKGQLTGNALVPLLIGRQGCGKSSFCRILLPRDLQDYYNDRISFKNEADLNLGLTSFALINLDEFDKITQRQQVVLKYLVSTADLKYRPPYGKAYSQHRRYASFIGTTNEQTPLTDPSGSRRFICVLINGDIDFQTPVQHDQLFAQLLVEINNGARYWLTKDEERALMQHNLKYQQLNGLGEMLMSIIQKPRPSEQGQWMTLKELSDLLGQHFKGYREDPSTFQKIGNYLNRPEYKFESRRMASGMQYLVSQRLND